MRGRRHEHLIVECEAHRREKGQVAGVSGREEWNVRKEEEDIGVNDT